MGVSVKNGIKKDYSKKENIDAFFAS